MFKGLWVPRPTVTMISHPLDHPRPLRLRSDELGGQAGIRSSSQFPGLLDHLRLLVLVPAVVLTLIPDEALDVLLLNGGHPVTHDLDTMSPVGLSDGLVVVGGGGGCALEVVSMWRVCGEYVVSMW